MTTRIVVHKFPLDLLRAVDGYPDADSVRTNHALGFVFARWLHGAPPPADEAKKPDMGVEVLATAWEGDDLRLIFTKLGWAQCKVVSPVAPTDLVDLAVPHVAALVERLVALAPFSETPALLRSLAGPQVLVDAFLTRWPHPSKPAPSMFIIPASIRTAPPPISYPPGHTFSRIQNVAHLPASDLSTIASLLIDFYGNHVAAPRFSPEAALAHTKGVIASGAFWVYRASAGPGPVAFVQTGRPTRTSCAVRMVYVAPAFRGAGVASRMVAAVARAHLVEAPRVLLDYARAEGAASETEEAMTRWGGKDEVCLFVEPGNDAARKAYARVGFQETEAFAKEKLLPWYASPDLAKVGNETQRAGEYRQVGNFALAGVDGAGHFVPYDKPKEALALFNRWIWDRNVGYTARAD